MNCWHCNSEVIWGGDHDYEDYGLEGEGIVSNLSCPKCDTHVDVYHKFDLPTMEKQQELFEDL